MKFIRTEEVRFPICNLLSHYIDSYMIEASDEGKTGDLIQKRRDAPFEVRKDIDA